MGSCCSYAEINDALYAWNKSTRRKIAGNNRYVDRILASVMSPNATRAVLEELEDLPPTVPEPKGTAENMPLALNRNCLFVSTFLNNKYEKVHRDLTGLLAETRRTYESAKRYLTALSHVDAALKASKAEARSPELEPLSPAGVRMLIKDADDPNSWTSLQEDLFVLVGSEGFDNPMYLNVTKVLLDLPLPDHPTLVKYVTDTVTQFAQHRIAKLA